MYLNEGDGTLTAASEALGGTRVALADVDGDGDLDVLLGAGTATLLYNDGSGTLTSSGLELGTGNSGVGLVDVDGDSDLVGPELFDHLADHFGPAECGTAGGNLVGTR